MSTPEEAARNLRLIQIEQEQERARYQEGLIRREQSVVALRAQVESLRQAREQQEANQQRALDIIRRTQRRQPGLQQQQQQLQEREELHEQGIPSRRYLTFQDAGSLLESGHIQRFIVDPQNQIDITPGLTRVTLIGIDGREYDVVARYDPTTNQIFPPA